MNKVQKRLFLLVALFAGLLLPSNTAIYAQSVVWVDIPQFDSMTQISESFYMVRNSRGKCGVVNANCKEVVAMNYDEITPFVEGYSLLLSNSNGRYRLNGILDKDGNTTRLFNMFVKDFKFFSQGLLAVMNEKGDYGYIDCKGNLLIEYKYPYAYPFREGRALVVKSGNVLDIVKKAVTAKEGNASMMYIDRQNQPIKLGKGIGKIVNATSYRHGKALVRTKNGVNLVIDLNGNIISEEHGVKFERDEYGAWNEDVQMTHDFSFKPNADTISIITQTTGNKTLYGYRNLCIPQFEDASHFVNGLAVVKNRYFNTYGLIRKIDGKVTVQEIAREKSENKGYDKVTYEFNLPNEFRSISAELRCITQNDGVKSVVSTDNEENTRRMTIEVPTISTYTLVLTCYQIDLWSEMVTSSTNATEEVTITLSAASVKADENDRAKAYVIVRNNTNKDADFNIKVTGKECSAKGGKFTIKKGDSTKILVTFWNAPTSSNETRTLTITVDGNKTHKNITIKPYVEIY